MNIRLVQNSPAPATRRMSAVASRSPIRNVLSTPTMIAAITRLSAIAGTKRHVGAEEIGYEQRDQC